MLCESSHETAKARSFVRTLRLKIKPESYSWFNAAAIEVNQVWNWANQVSAKAASPCSGPRKFLTGYDLDKLAAGASSYFAHIGSDTVQRINVEFAQKRKQAKRLQLRWRVSGGSKRSLGWIPFKALQLKRKGTCLRFCGKAFRVFEQALLDGVVWKGGNFAQDAVGDWWLCLPVERHAEHNPAPRKAVGLDLGPKVIVATSDGEKLAAGHFFRNIRTGNYPSAAPT